MCVCVCVFSIICTWLGLANDDLFDPPPTFLPAQLPYVLLRARDKMRLPRLPVNEARHSARLAWCGMHARACILHHERDTGVTGANHLAIPILNRVYRDGALGDVRRAWRSPLPYSFALTTQPYGGTTVFYSLLSLSLSPGGADRHIVIWRGTF